MQMNTIHNQRSDKLYNALDITADKLKWVCENNKDGIPYTLKETGTYNNMDEARLDSIQLENDVSWWTNGFFGGILWQMYHLTGEQKYCDYARAQEKKLDACFSIFEHINHDVGFMWLLTSVADYRLTADAVARRRSLHAATILAGRFNINGNYIRAWDGHSKHNCGWAIIDCLMNLSLLYWATKETGDPRFAAIARAHTDTAIKHFVREDGSVCHIVEFDPLSGIFIKSHGGQGYQEGSCWTRGQAWALYGFTNGYKNTQNEEYLQTARKTADFFLKHLPESYLVPVDFSQPNTGEDSSAACIAASGMLDLAKCLSEKDGKPYHDGAINILNALWENRICKDATLEALVTNCSVAYHDDKKINTLIYADYFFLEALLKINNKSLSMW
jgi:unsaturated chondroitin disaccharide hydrolase